VRKADVRSSPSLPHYRRVNAGQFRRSVVSSFSNTSLRSQARDRAHAAAGTIIAIVVDALRAWLHGESVTLANVHAQIAHILRDEFDDIKREVAGERFLAD
jgi:hypothetical protein